MKFFQITISRADIENVSEIKNLLSYTWNDTYGQFFSSEAIKKITSTWHSAENLRLQILDSTVFFAVAKNESQKIVGLITVRKVDENVIFMNRLYIHPNYQRQGIGTKLMKAAFDYFPKAKVLRVECEKKNNKACTFYLKTGFKQMNEKIETIEGIKMNTVEFEKIIKN